MDSLSREIVTWAKRAARASNRQALSALDFLCGVYAVIHERGKVPPELEDILGKAPTWDDSIVELFGKAKTIQETDERFPLDGTLQRVVEKTFYAKRDLPAPLLLRNLLAEKSDPAVADWLRRNRQGTPESETALLRFLSELSDKSARLERLLLQEVLGQEAAVGMLVQAYWEAALTRKKDGPRGIFTFLGPPGVGKTLLAETFARALAELESNAYAFRRFDMGSYAGHQNFEQLFGAEEYYKGGQPGTLTGFANENPRAVILLDEIEKAHDTTLTALLSVFDKGEGYDKFLKTNVSFRECFFILTTNLGQEFFSELNVAGIVHSGGAARALVLDILSSAKRRRESAELEAVPALPPELVSRIAKGGVVFFRPLSTSSYLTLIRKAIGRSRSEAGQAANLPFPEILLEEDVGFLFLLSLLPSFDARQVVARSEAWASELVRQAFEQCREELASAQPEMFTVDACLDDEARSWLENRFKNLELQTVLVDDDDYLVSHLENLSAPFNGRVHRVANERDALETVHRRGADVVLLDLSIDQPSDSANVAPALSLLRSLRSRFPEVPVWLFSENPKAREGFERVVDQVLKQGGARGFIPCGYHREGGTLEESFLSVVREHVILDAARDKLLRRFRREHKAVSFGLSFRFDAARGAVEVALGQVREGLVVSLADQTAAIKFSGVPTERLASVVGLDRAKRRLQQVISWLRDPSALAAFGASPPRGFLLAGPPGTGKTLLAKAVAGEAGLPFLALSASELKSKWYGESEQRIRELFTRAREYAPTIVFIDEIDSIGRRRDLDVGKEVTGVLQQLLASMDGLGATSRPIFVLAATNHPEVLDPALLRPGRFDEVIPIDLPNRQARQDFFDRRLAPVPREGEVDVDKLVQQTAGLTPAALDRIVREAIYAAAARGSSAVSQKDLENAVHLVRFGAPSESVELLPEERRRVAYHEAGHAVAHLELFPERLVDYVTILPRADRALGFVAFAVEEDRHLLTRREVEGRLVVALAGRQGELLGSGGKLEELSAGAADDLEQATALAWRAVAAWGFDPELGAVSVAGLPLEARGRVLEIAPTRVREWLAAAQAKAERIITTHSQLVCTLADQLLEKESLEWEELRTVLAPLLPPGGVAPAV